MVSQLVIIDDAAPTQIDITSPVTGTAVSYNDTSLTATATIQMRVGGHRRQ